MTELNRDPENRAEKAAKTEHRRVHMANERTYLAWIRTSIAIMAFGFVVERFSLFEKQMGYFAGQEISVTEISSWTGIFLVFLGVLMGVLAFARYKIVEKQIDEDAYRPSPILSALLLLSLLSIGGFLLFYLVQSM